MHIQMNNTIALSYLVKMIKMRRTQNQTMSDLSKDIWNYALA